MYKGKYLKIIRLTRITMALVHIGLLQYFLYISQLMAEPLINTGQAMYHHTNGTIVRITLFKVGYGPDGVLTSFHKFVEISDIVVYTFLLGSGLALIFITYLLFGGTGASEEDTDSSEECVSEHDDTEEVQYETQYFKELEDLPEKELSPEELAVIGEHVLMEDTPKGMVYMSYNAETEIFDYYTDKFVDVTYEILDTVARLFAITFQCKQVCVNYKEQVQKGEQNMLSEMEFDKLKKELDARNIVNNYNKERSVFASFKSYNKKNGNNSDKKYYIVTEKANHFKYKGKICDYEKHQKKTAAAEMKPGRTNISYSEFKQLHVQAQAQSQAQLQAQAQVQAQAQA